MTSAQWLGHIPADTHKNNLGTLINALFFLGIYRHRRPPFMPSEISENNHTSKRKVLKCNVITCYVGRIFQNK